MESQTVEVNVEEKVQDFCALIDSVVKVIKKPRRTEIIKVIYNEGKPISFNEIQEKTQIPSGSLYNHLNKLFVTGIISKTDERPAKYFLTDFSMKLLELPKK
ncbi:hypothetical protein BK007_02405 [Methanobacterium subterraneum]|uniref:HTH arsR-type domain-containing protein n=1 Tax=Methanobacterium subterraneum TaxID=59277 RepID=A0A2H4VA74_9EURY|nr:winged helix-turn-helix domain-containing protein [Methanobacterium subterraneum]AUB54981.1 hypothetical protein BK007_02405 [Methanobacterium subterraneum]